MVCSSVTVWCATVVKYLSITYFLKSMCTRSFHDFHYTFVVSLAMSASSSSPFVIRIAFFLFNFNFIKLFRKKDVNNVCNNNHVSNVFSVINNQIYCFPELLFLSFFKNINGIISGL